VSTLLTQLSLLCYCDDRTTQAITIRPLQTHINPPCYIQTPIIIISPLQCIHAPTTRDPSRITPRRAKRLPMRSLPGPSPPSSPPTSMGEGGDYRGGCNLQRRLLLPLAAAALRSRPEPVTTGSHRAGRPPGPSAPGSLVSSLQSSRRRVTHAPPPRPTPLPPVLADTLAAASPSSTWKGKSYSPTSLTAES